jgi:hypothetical protein
MERSDYDRVLDQLTTWAARQPSVLGLVAVGSTAGVDRAPDRWSDHDVAVITEDGAAAALREDLSWLPDASRIALTHRGTEHAWCVVYDDGHLMEIAVFDNADLRDLGINSFRVLVDRSELEERFAELRTRTDAQLAAADPDGSARFRLFATELVVGLSRLGRGEPLSAHSRVHAQGLPCLLALIADLVPPERSATLDGLDPHRGFESAYPARAERLRQALESPLLETVQTMLDMVRRDLADRLPPEVLTVLPAIDLLVGCVAAADGRRAPGQAKTSEPPGSARTST